jgi:pSer/pThr/pTyr-binding forkhead associated (FHA) protein
LNNVTGQSSYDLTNKLTQVGRLPGKASVNANYVVIDETTIGRRHAIIEYKNHGYWITDQNSLNGTFVNNQRIEGETQLKHGDHVRFHSHEFEFVMPDMFGSGMTQFSQTVFAGSPFTAEEDPDATVIRPDGMGSPDDDVTEHRSG